VFENSHRKHIQIAVYALKHFHNGYKLIPLLMNRGRYLKKIFQISEFRFHRFFVCGYFFFGGIALDI